MIRPAGPHVGSGGGNETDPFAPRLLHRSGGGSRRRRRRLQRPARDDIASHDAFLSLLGACSVCGVRRTLFGSDFGFGSRRTGTITRLGRQRLRLWKPCQRWIRTPSLRGRSPWRAWNKCALAWKHARKRVNDMRGRGSGRVRSHRMRHGCSTRERALGAVFPRSGRIQT